MPFSRLLSLLLFASLLAGCAQFQQVPSASGEAEQETLPEVEMAQGADARARAQALRPRIERHAQENELPIALANAVIRIESNFNPRVVHAGNYGLMQIKLATARAVGFGGSAADLLDPETNLHYGLKYLGSLYQQSQGDLCITIMKYQSGHRALRMSASNRAYCRRVKGLMTLSG
ncbi:MAG: transglycosylase SLT domain-containing protein [Hyphomicrobiales bacterium]|nr:transglycosylase SLT domain-containing protein [Hyphomicrobiales bacterium]MBV9974553.1 transglycosylase SLT domain-containing protein [Hyphomicrobiales bacterium]